ncbi:MAG: DUF1329 domain-containing protein [Thermodesulfobacteriota bacterium]|nr:DUF1329 domain-containing protein [Thermodesulfobacteriota bacterium]
MKRIFLIPFILVMIPNFTKAHEYKIKPGIIITKENYSKYLPELKRLLPVAPFPIVINALEKGWITLPVIEKQKFLAPSGFAKASAGNKGKFKVGVENKLIGPAWNGGSPFPDPETGSELGWSLFRRRECAEEFYILADQLLVDKKCKIERSFTNFFHKKSFVGRTDIHPIPEIRGNNGLIFWKESMLVTKPFDVKGFSMVRIHYEDLYRNDDVYSYIPAIRRLRRLTGSDTTDPVLGSDCCYDDFEGWHQKLDPKMTFKILGIRDFILTRYYRKKPPEPYIRYNCYQLEWQIRPLFILEIKLNDPNYPYSRRIFYIEKERGTFDIEYGECYDQKGRFWRSNFTIPLRYYDNSSNQSNYWGGSFTDHLSRHYTMFRMDPIDLNLGEVFIAPEMFTIRGLLKKAR